MPGYNVRGPEEPYLTDDEMASLTDPNREGPSATLWRMTLALQGMSHVYAGTVDPAEVARRRKRNKAARRARRINRLAAQR